MRLVTDMFRRRGRKAVLITTLGVVGGLLLVGGGVYAALGGTFRPQSSSDIELQRGLVGWYKLDGNAADSTPYRDNGTVSGAVATADREGKTAGALSFDGATNEVSIPDAGQLDNGSMTASLWLDLSATIDCDGNNNWRSLINKGSTSGTTTGWDVVLEQNMGVQFDVGTGTTSRSGGIGVGMQLNVPILLTFTYDAATGMRTIYANGVQKYSSAITAAPLSANSSPIGLSQGTNSGSCPSGSGHVPGIYDDVRIYNRAISAAEAKALYDQYDASVQAGSGEKGLVGWWKLDGDTKDSSPYRHAATDNGATLAPDRKGAANSAYSFNGTSNYMTVPDDDIYSPATITVSAWVYWTGGGTNNIVSKGGNSEYRYRINSNGTISVFDRGATNDFTTTDSINPNTWYLLSFTGDALGLKMYINGQLSASKATAYAPPNTSGLLYFGTYSGTSEFMTGSINDIRIYNRVLSQPELQALYESYRSQINLSANPTNTASSGNINQGLVGYWNFNGNAKDSTPYRNNGTVNGATLTTDRQGRANDAYNFNGSTDYIALSPTANLPMSAGTVSLWLKIQDNAGAAQNFLFYGNSVEDGCGGANTVALSTCGFIIQSGSNTASRGVPSLTDNQWHLLTGTWDAGTSSMTLYVDGALSSSGSLSFTPSFSPQVANIGKPGPASRYTFGSLDDIRIYNRALSLGEVQTLYASGN